MESQFLILWMVVTTFVPVHSAQCPDSVNVFGGGCVYSNYRHAATKSEADGCCGGSLTIVAPTSTQLMDYGRLIENSGAYHSAFTMTNSKLFLHGEEINGASYSIYWMDDTQPTGDVPCIAAKHDSERLVLFPVSCSDQLRFVCLSVDNDSCHSCSEEERCMPEFTKYGCRTNCTALPLPSAPPTTSPSDNPTNPTDIPTERNNIAWVIPVAVVVPVVIFVTVVAVVLRKRKQNYNMLKART